MNDMLSWDDVSEETKDRLGKIEQEIRAAYSRKYPDRPPEGWQQHTQKYRPPGSTRLHQVPMPQLLGSLHALWREHEGKSR